MSGSVAAYKIGWRAFRHTKRGPVLKAIGSDVVLATTEQAAMRIITERVPKSIRGCEIGISYTRRLMNYE